MANRAPKKILIDMHISPELVGMFDPNLLQIDRALDFFPQDADDIDIYLYAWAHGYDAVISRDIDFKDLLESSLATYKRTNESWRTPSHPFYVAAPPKLIRIKDQQMKKEVFLRLMHAFYAPIMSFLHRSNRSFEFGGHYLCVKAENLSPANQDMVLNGQKAELVPPRAFREHPTKKIAKQPVRRHHKPR